MFDVVVFVLMFDDLLICFKGKFGVGKIVVWDNSLVVDEVKVVGKVLGVFVNDVLLFCVVGVIGCYLVDRGEDLIGKEICVMVFVNLCLLE